MIIKENTHKELELENIEDLTLEKNSSLKLVLINPNKDISIKLKENSELNLITIQTKETSSNIKVNLLEKESRINLIGFIKSKNRETYNLHTEIIHNAPRTFSDIKTRSILEDESKVFNSGLIKIEKNAKKSQGYEKIDMLILSEKSLAKPIPNLEIKNHDVKCSHGATTGKINKDQIFYLMSRGLSEEKSKRLIIGGYFEPLLNSINNKNLRKKLELELK